MTRPVLWAIVTTATLAGATACGPGTGDIAITDQRFPPSCEVLWPAADGEVLEGQAFELAVSISDSDTPFDELAVRAVSDLDGILPGEADIDELGATLLVEGHVLQEGYHTVTVTVTDETHVVDCVQSFYVKPNSDPSVNFDDPDPGGTYLSAENLLVEISVFDAEESDLSAIELEWNGIAADQPTAPAHPDGDGRVSWYLPRLAAGNYTIGVRATDSVGGSRSAAVTFDVVPTDADGDGWIGVADGGQDCDDTQFAVHPSQLEVCNGIDDNCDGTIDEPDATDAVPWFLDADSDGHGNPSGAIVQCTAVPGRTATGGDCDDTDAAVHPAADEVCDGVDNDCSGAIDDNPTDGTPFYADVDGDTFGDLGVSVVACALGPGLSPVAGDCDDNEAGAYPGATEACGNSIDDDCDGAIDEACVVEYCGPVTVATVWTRDIVHRITCPVDIQTTVTVEEGAQVEWDAADASISVGTTTNGRLMVQGVAGDPVRFVSSRPTDEYGWLAFGRYDTGSVLEHFEMSTTLPGLPAITTDADDLSIVGATLIDVPSDGIHAVGGRITVTDSAVFGSGGVGLRVDGELAALDGTDFDDTLVAPLELRAGDLDAIGAGNDFVGNYSDVVRVVPSRVETSLTWTDVGVPLLLLGDVEVGDVIHTPTLTLADGVQLRFVADAALRIGTTLPGTIAVDDTAGPVVLGPEASGTPWGGLVFGPYAEQPVLAGLHIEGAGGGLGGALTLDGIDLRIEGVTVTDTSGGAGLLTLGSAVEIVDSVFERNVPWAVDTRPGELSLFSGNTLHDNFDTVAVNTADLGAFDGTSTWTGATNDERIQAFGRHVTTSTYWVPEAVPYRLRNGVELSEAALYTLTLADGIELHFDGGDQLLLGQPNSTHGTGRLEIEPGASQVLFRSSSNTPAAGDWLGILVGRQGEVGALEGLTVAHATVGIRLSFPSAPVDLANVTTLESLDAGIDASRATRLTLRDITVDGGAIGVSIDDQTDLRTLERLTITNTDIPLALDQSQMEVIGTDNVFTSNADNRIHVSREYRMGVGVTIEDPGVPWYFTNGSEVSNLADVTLAPGVEWHFAPGTALQLGPSHNPYGILTARGTASNPVVFSSGSPSPAAGDWQGIVNDRRGVIDLEHVVVEYAGDASGTGAINVLDEAEATLSDVEIRDSAGHGIYWDSTSPQPFGPLSYTNIALDDFYEP